jgi:hypothetical protein
MEAKNFVLVSEDFKKLLDDISVTDFTFKEHAVSSHPDSLATKVGFRPIMIRSTPLPEEMSITYVRSKDENGVYWYVVSWLNSPDKNLREYSVKSEQEAKEIILEELKKSARINEDRL